ncbi:MAG TPA: VIT1/CCC1 transporter family protein [Methylomirabilota bacterium]|jgi:VIT1/CCC1 family predicted Fe2+/Mn2+ transporter
MVLAAHPERHFTGSRAVRDLVLGMADGLTVPFALAAGLTGAIDATWIIVVAGLAEIAAGAIAMAMGGYLAAKSDAEHYESERRREQREVHDKPQAEAAEVFEVLEGYGVKPEAATPLVDALQRNPEGWVDFMMRFELGLERPDPRRALFSAFTIGGAYVLGGLIPLWPYMAIGRATTALAVSSVVTLVALLLFGYVKGRFTGAPPVRSALQTAFIGGIAAAVAFAVASAITM